MEWKVRVLQIISYEGYNVQHSNNQRFTATIASSLTRS